jgi:glutamate N-acetyltransferase/amino-acid N-acetyltransferase
VRCNGFRFGTAASGVKSEGALDLGVIISDRPASAAAIFTSNRVPAAPVTVSRRALDKSNGIARAVVVNSGNANACTGPQGMSDARAMVSRTAELLDVPPGQVVVGSTGVIGVPLAMDRVDLGITEACTGARATGFKHFSEAIMTTDKRAKAISRTVAIGDRRVTLIGCTKGAGMIAPNMATTLSFVCTDARITPLRLDASLRTAAAESFNAIVVDGDTSTNDMILCMANGSIGGPTLRGKALRAFDAALAALLTDLATALMGDGEGVHHVVTVNVTGARSVKAARAVARAIAISPLVKTAIAGRDPNWGRILAAAGNAGVPVRPDRMDLLIGGVKVAEDGMAIPRDVEARAAAVMKRERYELTLDLGMGRARAHYLACDLSHEYVSINADYRS